MRVSLEELVVGVPDRDPDPAFLEVSDAALVEGFARQASEIAAATCQWLLVLAEIIRRGLWAGDGMTSPATWLSWSVSMAASTAREHVRVAVALADWPVATAEFAAGRISFTKMRAIVSTGRPELDRLLVKYAACSSGEQLHQICRMFRTTDRRDAVVDRWAARDLTSRELAHGLTEIRLVVPTEDAEVALQGIDRRAEQLRRQQPAAAAAAAEGDDPGVPGAAAAAPDPIGHRRADAALEAFARLADTLPDDVSGQDRHLVVLHTVSAAVAAPADGEDRWFPVETDTAVLPSMSARVIRRLSCTGRVRHVEHDPDGEVVAVRDQRRSPTASQRRKLLLRDRGCRFPSCGRRRGLHAHHIVHWEDGGPTELPNLVLLCGTHHRFVHDHGWTIATDGHGRFSFAPPDRVPIPAAATLPGTVPVEIAFPRWPDGSSDGVDPWLVWPRAPLAPTGATARPDYDACIDVLHLELERHRPPAPDDIVIAA